jgi:hypothetical protein
VIISKFPKIPRREGKMVKKTVKKTAKKTMKSSTTKKTTPKKVSRGADSFRKLSTEELYDLISKKAYELYTERGFGHGDDHSDWYRAECYIRSKYKF